MKHQGYVTRALKARDSRYARVLGKLGYETTQLAAGDAGDVEDDPSADAELTALRHQYREKVGKKAFHGWNADDLRGKIATHQAGQD